MLQLHPWAAVFAAAAVASAASARMMRRRGGTPAAAALVVVLLGSAWWSAVRVLSFVLVPPALQVAADLAIYPGVAAIVAGFWCHARAMADRRWRWRWRREGWLLVEPVLLVLAAATNPLHDGLRTRWQPLGDPPVLTSHGGPLFDLHTAYSYAVLATAGVLLVRAAVRAAPTHRPRFLWPVLAMVFPTVGNVVSVWLLDEALVDLTPVLFLVTAALCWWALEHEALPDVLPVALRQVVAAMGDGVLVVDRLRRVVEVNPAGEALLRRLDPGAPEHLVGLPLRGPVDPLGEDPPRSGPAQRAVDLPEHGLHLDLRTTPLTDAEGDVIGWVVIARDIAVERAREAALETRRHEAERASQALREQLALVERLRAELAERAARDPLTGLANRRRLLEVLTSDVPAALAAGRPVSLLMLDVDRFKRVNDEEGHAVGDAVLVAIAAAAADGVGRRELAARYGGEELVLVLPGCDADAAARRAEALRASCAAVTVPGASGEPVGTTVSIGVATAPGGSTVDATGLLAAADRALYAAKAGGRDRVVTAAPEDVRPPRDRSGVPA
ncbi:diguanylate cyclase [Cellulomonas endophytica]|uniref:diguanylate cyclase n=1 Tax=Cellulomonas endophytica TaxID=2494735 RepID=UPI0013E90055|nr:diguanylate cyclase [Cellulomonas endophytica]